MDSTPIILVINDDGIRAPGIHQLAHCLPDEATIYVVAPDDPHSGQSSAITVKNALRITEHPEYSTDRIKAYSVNGTPVDCVKVAAHAILPGRPVMAVAGINHGSNAGCSVIYSGTMGAVMETCMLGIPSVGFSLLDHSLNADFAPCLEHVKAISKAVYENGLPKKVCLNVNFPKTGVIKGMKVVGAAQSHWTDEYEEYVDPHGKKFYMLTGELINEEPENPGTDLYWLERDYGTIVPATPEQTRFDVVDLLKPLLECC